MKSFMMRATRRSAAIAVLALAIAASISAQSSIGIVRGHVLGPDGKPLPGQAVVLHRVTGSNGLTVATGTSESDGSFRLRVTDVTTASEDAVYFLAARYNQELYIGDAFKAPFDTTADHNVRVGVAETSARALVSGVGDDPAVPQAPPPKDPTRWLIFIMPALALIALIVMLFGPRGRVPARRRILLEIAKLDESNATTGGSSEYEQQRAALLAKLNAESSANARLNTPASV
jgi:hypothetical protein